MYREERRKKFFSGGSEHTPHLGYAEFAGSAHPRFVLEAFVICEDDNQCLRW